MIPRDSRDREHRSSAPGRNGGGAGRARGFTLLEALVALAILAIALTAAMRGIGLVAQSAGELRARQLAELAAENRLAEARILGRFPEPGRNEGETTQAGLRFLWREKVAATPNPLFRRIEIEVAPAEQPQAVLGRLAGYLTRAPQ